MYLSKETKIQLNDIQSNIVGHLGYAAYKLWNVLNYERQHYKDLELDKYPDYYYQKKNHKTDMWYKSLASQTAQEVCKQLDKAWASFYALKESGGVKDPNPPRFKHDKMAITYMQNGLKHEAGSDTVKLTLPKQLKEHMKSTYGIKEQYLILENGFFRNFETIKQLKIYPPMANGTCRLIVIYEIPDPETLPDNGHYLSIDIGLHNFMTCYDSNGSCFIIGRKYLSIYRRYDKEIARIQSQWDKAQKKKGIKYPKMSKHVLKLYKDKKNRIDDYLHKLTRYITDYCKKNNINTVVIGDITNIRKGKDLGAVTNQKLHALPFKKIYDLLSYKLMLEGITLIKQKEAYTSQCPPTSPSVCRKYAQKKDRIQRGLYKDGNVVYNADAVGAYNILRKYLSSQNIQYIPSVRLSSPRIIKVAA